MFERILLPTDGSEASARAIAAGVAFARDLGASVVGMTVTPAFHVVTADASMLNDIPDQFAAEGRRQAGMRLDAVAQAAREAGVPCRLEHAVADHPGDAIIAGAQTLGCDLIAMASHGRGALQAALLGSTTQRVLAGCDVPVRIYR